MVRIRVVWYRRFVGFAMCCSGRHVCMGDLFSDIAFALVLLHFSHVQPYVSCIIYR